MSTVTPSLVTEKVTVDSIQYTEAADPNVQDVSEATGGMYFYDDGSAESTKMIDGLMETLTWRHTPCSDLPTVSVSIP